MTTQAISGWTVTPLTKEMIKLVREEKWFQLTEASQRPGRGSIESMNAFSTADKTIHLEFDYLSWGGNGGKGLAIYLFDSSVNNAGTGGIGGVGLGYVKMIGAYIGIGLDESSSFTLLDPKTMTENSKDLGVGLGSAITVRGSQAGSYLHESVNRLPNSLPLFSSATQYKTRQEAIAGGGVKHVSVDFTPQKPEGYTVDLTINGLHILNKFSYPYAAPASMKIGVAATNGPDTSSNHEIQNFRATTAEPAPPPVDLFKGALAYVAHPSSPGYIDAPFLTDGDHVHRGWDGKGLWDNFPPDHLSYEVHLDSAGVEVNTIVVYCRQDDVAQVEPSNTTTFSQHGAIDFRLDAFDDNFSFFELASVSGNNLVKRTFTVPSRRYRQVLVHVNHAVSMSASIVAIEGFKL